MTTKEWKVAALKRMRVMDTQSRTSGNLIRIEEETAVIYLGYEQFGMIRRPQFIRVPLAEVQPE